MPEGMESASPNSVYFGQSPKFKQPVGALPDTFSRVFVEHLGEQRRKKLGNEKFNCFDNVGTLIDKLGKKKNLTPDEKEIQTLIAAYENFFVDISFVKGSSNRAVKEGVHPGEIDYEQAVDNAVFNQGLARDILTLKKGNCDENQRQSVLLFSDILRAMADKDVALGAEGERVFNGARAQAAVMNTLFDNGYQVYAPDPDKKDEVKMWDVDGGVDMVAIGNDDQGRVIIHMIDIKGERFAGESIVRSNISIDRVPDAHKNPIRQKAQLSVLEDLKKLGISGDGALIFEEILRVPTDGIYITPFGTFSESAGKFVKNKFLKDFQQWEHLSMQNTR